MVQQVFVRLGQTLFSWGNRKGNVNAITQIYRKHFIFDNISSNKVEKGQERSFFLEEENDYAGPPLLRRVAMFRSSLFARPSFVGLSIPPLLPSASPTEAPHNSRNRSSAKATYSATVS